MIRPIENAFLLLILLTCCHFQLTTAVSQEWCLERGFDPSNLSCDTCALLEESTTLISLQKEKNAKNKGGGGEQSIDVVAECRTCCQVHKVNPILHPGESLRGKYRYALLTYDEHTLESYGEIKDFIERDMDDVLSFKGENRFRAVKLEKQGGMQDIEMMMRMGMVGGFGGGPPKLMLFEKQKKGGWSEDDEEEAGEVITLRGWKREDVKDMLLT
eukprot:CAMPEP_0201645886 /NCGR_PEP_ID=MMETSP0493-20130528/32950_1 /ASSEMBLY_ACC=CAM_ASM_000838 /TAXON_ID=420259 /ORGANISM="Thalassiosira gravida, Strain GMp14c1" /LENGTH=214 /DNA_ID=CAMNT_0048120921 /DNA_START=44 /DNA_END=684 /DNA_ORIENTATION=-